MVEKRTVIVNQDNYDIIPFVYEIDSEKSSSTTLEFSIKASSALNMDYEALISNNSYAVESTDALSTYVPQPEGSTYIHDAVSYIDLIVERGSGVRAISARFDPERYEFEMLDENDDVFVIPKFEWDNSIDGTSSDTDYWVKTNAYSYIAQDNPTTFGFYMGDGDGYLNHVIYDAGEVGVDEQINLNSPVHHIYLGSSKLYVSTNEYYRGYGYGYYVNGRADIGNSHSATETIIVGNNSSGQITLVDSNVWATESYTGDIKVLANNNVLSLVTEYKGLDAPHKILKSKAHNTYFCAGTHMLWKLEDGAFSVVHQANDYTISDFAISDTGEICILMESESGDDVIRILHKNLYDFILDKRLTDERVRYCKYCGQGRFYILAETFVSSVIYKANNYVYNLLSKTLESEVFEGDIATTTTTTTLGESSTAVTVTNPNGFEEVERGRQYEIRWISSKSITDLIKIELYKGGTFHSTIINPAVNTGIYKWNVSSDLAVGSDYKIYITWLSASSDTNNIDSSDNNFSVVDEGTEVTTTTTTRDVTNEAIGIDFDEYHDQILIVLENGMFAIFYLEDMTFYGVYMSGLNDILSMAVENNSIAVFGTQEKVRVFVGSAPYLSDKWDSGIVETNLTSMYYGGRKNLEAGTKYYANIQTYSELTGWSDIQTKEFIIPK